MEVATASAMRNIDQRTIEMYRVPGIVLMENAGLALLRFIQTQWPDLHERHVTILAGPGNNGGDGFILARHLWHRGVSVRVIMLATANRLRGDARRAYAMARAYGTPMITCTTEQAWQRIAQSLQATSIFVDAILGTGLRQAVSGLYTVVIETVNQSGKPIVAVDIPSGLMADHGQLVGPHIQATHTVTFALPKCGLLVYPAAAAVGKLHTVDIGIPHEAVRSEGLDVALLDPDMIGSMLPTRQPDAHKGRHGHVMIVAGSLGKSGASVLTSQAALRAGAGLATLAIPFSLNMAMETHLTEVMTLPVAETPTIGIGTAAIPDLCKFLQTASVLVLGPGLGTHPETMACVHALIRNSQVPVVLDADGLNNLVGHLEVLRACAAPIIMTPHPGEMARLLGISTADVQAQRLTIARDFVRNYQVYVVLKGARTVMYTPEGYRYINSTGNAAMATAGAGDVLAGLIGALLAQGLSPLEAMQCGVYTHGLAGDRVRDGLGSTGLIASDLIEALPHTMDAMRRGLTC